jgi:hypothetical protein
VCSGCIFSLRASPGTILSSATFGAVPRPNMMIGLCRTRRARTPGGGAAKRLKACCSWHLRTRSESAIHCSTDSTQSACEAECALARSCISSCRRFASGAASRPSNSESATRRCGGFRRRLRSRSCFSAPASASDARDRECRAARRGLQ